jgi:hypothetical protein
MNAHSDEVPPCRKNFAIAKPIRRGVRACNSTRQMSDDHGKRTVSRKVKAVATDSAGAMI